MKNTPKTFKKVLPCAIGLGLLSFSILAPFTGLKTANADFPPVYEQFPDNNELLDNPFSLFTLFFSRGDDTSYNGFYYDLPRSNIDYLSGRNYNYTLDEDSFSGNITVRQSANQQQIFIDCRNTVYDDLTVNGNHSIILYNTRPFYCDSGLYNALVRSTSAPCRLRYSNTATVYGNMEYIFNLAYYICNDTAERKTMSFTVPLETNAQFNYTGSLPTYDKLTENAVYPDYIYIERISIQFKYIYSATPAYGSTATFTLSASGVSPLSLSTGAYNDTQNGGMSFFATKTLRPVDDIGLGVITNAVSSFLNVEFVPGFKLWYFLLIGLGCAIVGIGLKFFFGG